MITFIFRKKFLSYFRFFISSKTSICKLGINKSIKKYKLFFSLILNNLLFLSNSYLNGNESSISFDSYILYRSNVFTKDFIVFPE